ncbi:hypothetical protein LCGC14_0874980 [marine sediment metagenome]|uniref:Uncharacterized protein n=1 Tax=marine sediment metagenome TaxID=412755 RepID=A0A0F9P3M5_9ZZZZ
MSDREVEIPKADPVKKATLAEHGPELPIGVLDQGGGYRRDVALRPWKLKQERVLGALLGDEFNLVQYVEAAIGTMCTRLGPHSLEAMKPEECTVVLSQMWMADVFFAYLLIRVRSLGNLLPLKLTCPNCGVRFDHTADLSTVVIRSVGRIEDAQWQYDVRRPFEIRGKKVEKLLMGPPRWSSLAQIPGNVRNFGDLKAGILLGSIYEVAGQGQMVLIDGELDDMEKEDIEVLTRAIDDNSVGPDMSIEGECKSCRKDYTIAIEWSNRDFFAPSSR